MVLEKIKDALGSEEGEEKEEEPQKVELFSLEELRGKIEGKKEEVIRETEEELSPKLGKISNVKKKIEDIRDNLSDAEPSEEVHPNLYKSAQEANRLFLKKVNRATERITVPSEPNWGGLIEFNRSLQKTNNILKSALVSHGNQVGMLFGDMLNKFRRLVDRLKSLSKELNTTLRKRKLKLDDLDELSEDISRRGTLLEEEKSLKEEIGDLEDQKEGIKEELEEKRGSLESLKKSQRFEELEENKEKREKLAQEKKRIRKKIDSKISSLARPLRKMSKLIEKDEHMVGTEVLKALDSYLENPVESALSEDEELPRLRAMVQELENVLQNKMKLDERERRKRLDEVRDIIEDRAVKDLRETYFEKEEERKNLKKERESSSLLEKKENLEESIRSEKSGLDEIEEKIEDAREELSEIEEDIRNKGDKIKEKAKSIFDAEVKELS